MDLKQFEMFQTTIQWVLDEKRITAAHGRHGLIWHRQSWWASGKVTDTVVQARSSTIPFTTSKQFKVICPSAACVAGNIVSAYGDKLVVPEGAIEECTAIADYCIDDEGRLHLIGDRAAALAGLSTDEAARLFAPNNSRDYVIELATEIASNHGYELELV